MSERDVMRMLSEANPVRADHLEESAPAELFDSILARRPYPSRRLVLATAVVVAAVGASLIGMFVFGGASSNTVTLPGAGMNDALPSLTLARPLAPGANEVALADATATFGPGLVLPDMSLVGPSDVGAVWMYSNRDETMVTVAVTFPKQGIFIQYIRPYPGPGVSPRFDVRAHYAAIARKDSYFHLLDLNGVPALAADQNSDDTGHNFGVVAFPMTGDEVRVFGHYDQATLQEIGQSIVDLSPPALGNASGINLLPIQQPWTRVQLPEAPAMLGAPIVLPSPSLAGMPDAVWAGGKCCLISVSFPAKSLKIMYERGSSISVDELATKVGAAGRRVDLNGVPALVVTPGGRIPSWLDFVLGGTRIVVSGGGDEASLIAVAQSIVDRSHS